MQQTTDLPDRHRPAREVDMPPCPLTGKPALRRVHGVPTKTIESIWRHGQGSGLGLTVVEAVALPPSPYQGMVFWLHRLLFKRTGPAPCERYIAHRWSWHASVALAYQQARNASRIRTMPAGIRPIDAFLVARKDA